MAVLQPACRAHSINLSAATQYAHNAVIYLQLSLLLLPSADFAPFNVDVTTNQPPAGTNNSTFVRIMIGGNGDWYGDGGGVGAVSWPSRGYAVLLAGLHCAKAGFSAHTQLNRAVC
jgi:hypothetical protein